MTSTEITAPNKLQAYVDRNGGIRTFARRMGRESGTEGIAMIVRGERVPTPKIRAAIVDATDGELTEQDIIDITGKEKHSNDNTYFIDPHWDEDEGKRRAWIISRAAKKARAQRLANEKAQG